MQALRLLAVLVLLTAGCVGPATPDEGDPTRGGATGTDGTDGPNKTRIQHHGLGQGGGNDALAFTEPVAVNQEGYGYEPSIEVGPDGTLYVTAHKASDTNEGTRLASWLWYSQDNGSTWQDMPSPIQVHEQMPALEGDFALDAQGRFYYVDLTAADNTLSRWSPGPSWDWSRPVQGTLNPDDRPWLAAHGDGIVYYVGNAALDLPAPNNLADGEGSRYWLSVSEDAGITWEPRYGFANSWWCTIDASRTDDRTVYAACTEPGLTGGVSGDADRIVAYQSTDRGESWERSEIAALARFSSSGYPATAADLGGSHYIAWTDLADGAHATTSLWMGHRAPGQAWTVDELTPFNGTFERPWTAAGSAGTVALSFYATNDSEPGQNSEWYPYALVTREATEPDGRWHLAQLSTEPVAIGPRSPGDFFQCAVGPDDTVHVVFGKQLDRTGPDPSGPSVRRVAEEILYVRQTAWPNVGR